MRFDDISEVAGPKNCWPGHRKIGTQPGTGKNAGQRVNKCKRIGEEIDPADVGEYDREGDMAMGQLKTAEDAAAELRSILDADENLPEWVQTKITKAVDYLDTVRDYMKSKEQGVAEGRAGWWAAGATAGSILTYKLSMAAGLDPGMAVFVGMLLGGHIGDNFGAGKIYKIYINGKDVSKTKLTKDEAFDAVIDLLNEDPNKDTVYSIVNTETKKVIHRVSPGEYIAKGPKTNFNRLNPFNEEQGVEEGKDNLESLRAKAKQISDKIDSIVQSGGRVGLDDPLSRQLKAIHNKIKQAKQGVAEGSLKEFAPSDSDDGGDDGFSEETLKRLAAQWYNGDEDPRVERTLMAAGWEIGQDEGYDDEPGVFVVQRGDVNGNSYISWPAHELKKGVTEGLNEFAPAGGGGNTPRGPRTPGRDSWDGNDGPGDDPYSRPEPEYYKRSIDFFGQFEADHFDDEEFDKKTGVFKGYWDDEEGRVQIAYFKFDDPQQAARDFDDSPGMGWYYEPQNESITNTGSALSQAVKEVGGGRRYTSYHDELSSRERDEQNAMDYERRAFKRAELQHELGHEDDPNFERNLRQQQMDRDRGPWYIRIDGKIYRQKGEPKSFDWKRAANSYALTMIKNNPALQGKIMLTKNTQDQ